MTDRPYRERTCAYCGELFQATQEFRSYRRKYCSQECTGKAHHERTIAKYPPREEVVRLYVEERLTDRELGRRFGHSYQWALKLRRHYGIAGRPTGPKARPKPLSQRSHRARWNMGLKPADSCRNCGVAVEGLHLHHAVPRSLAPAAKFDLRNGIQLCPACHLSWHQGKPISRAVFTEDEWQFIATLIGPSWLDRRYPAPDADLTQRCKRGHPMEGDNIAIAGGKRRCRACTALREARYRAERKAA